MPYCSLSENAVIEQAKLIFGKSKKMRARADLQDLYCQVSAWTPRSIVSVADKKVSVAKFAFKGRVIGVGNSRQNIKYGNATLEKQVEFTVLACDDELFMVANGEKYFYCSQAGEEEIDGRVAQMLGSYAGKRLKGQELADSGYVVKDCIIDSWEHKGKTEEYYTAYEIAYAHEEGWATLTFVGMGNKLVLCSDPLGKKPEKQNTFFGKKKATQNAVEAEVEEEVEEEIEETEEEPTEEKKKSKKGLIIAIVVTVVIVAAVAVGLCKFFGVF